MPEILSGVLATPGLVWLCFAIGVAGLVRGFTGFGTALIVVPVANIFLSPKEVIVVIMLTGIASNAVILRRAWGQGEPKEVGVLVLAALVTVPLGLMLLDLLDNDTVRWIITGVAAGMLAALIAGWRYTRAITRTGLLAIGAAAGIVGGLTGLTGPVVILFYLSGQAAVQSVRGNTILFLAALDVVLIANLLWQGAVTAELAVLAVVMSVPYLVTTLIGQALFDPTRERLYRWAAYGVIALAVVSGLPLWD
jgi:uncharacterized membrane protein YfcA